MYLHGKSLPDVYIVSLFFYKKPKQARVPTFVCLFRDDATTARGPGCDEGTHLRQRDFVEVPLMPTRVVATQAASSLIPRIFVTVSYLFRISVSYL